MTFVFKLDSEPQSAKSVRSNGRSLNRLVERFYEASMARVRLSSGHTISKKAKIELQMVTRLLFISFVIALTVADGHIFHRLTTLPKLPRHAGRPS